MGSATTEVLCNHAALIDIASAIFGDNKDKPKTVRPENDVTAGAPTVEAALQSMNSLLNFGG